MSKTKQTPKPTAAANTPTAESTLTGKTAPVIAPTPPVEGKTRVLGGYQVNFRLPTQEHIAALDGWLLSQGYTSRPEGVAAIVEEWAAKHSPELSAKLDAAILESVTTEAEAKLQKEREAAEARLREAEAKLKAVTDDPRIVAARDRMAKRARK